jgi:hypothetical protein
VGHASPGGAIRFPKEANFLLPGLGAGTDVGSRDVGGANHSLKKPTGWRRGALRGKFHTGLESPNLEFYEIQTEETAPLQNRSQVNRRCS